jgi:hypothetical protein
MENIMFEDVTQEVLLQEAVTEVAFAMEQNYADWMQSCADASDDGVLSDYRKQSIKDFKITVEEGNKYYKLMKTNAGGTQKSVNGFICKVDNPKKGFQAGDLLKAAGYNSPATNFTRGSAFDPKTWDSVRWTGIL